MIVLRSDSGETHVRRHATWGMYDNDLGDVDRAVAALADILAAGAWDRPEYHRRAAVT